MNEIPMGPPPAKPSVVETFNDFCAWLDEATEAEERAEDEERATVPTVGQRYTTRGDATRTVTVTRVWQANDGHTVVAYDIWEPGYRGEPGSWFSACNIDVFHRAYRPMGKDEEPSS